MGYIVSTYVMAILIYLTIILFFIWFVLNTFKNYFCSSGKGRRIAGEFLRDLGIATLVGVSFSMKFVEPAYYVMIFISSFMLIIGIIMKEDKK